MSFETRLLILSENLYDEFREEAFPAPLELPPPFKTSRTVNKPQVQVLLAAIQASERSLMLTASRVSTSDSKPIKVVFQTQTQFVVALSDLGPQEQWRLEVELSCDPDTTEAAGCANVRVDGRWVIAVVSDSPPGKDTAVRELWPRTTRSFSAPPGETWLIPLPDIPKDAMRPAGNDAKRRGFILLRSILLESQEHEDELFPSLPEDCAAVFHVE